MQKLCTQDTPAPAATAAIAARRLAAGADPLLQDADGETPLHKAAAQGHAAAAAVLIAAAPAACGLLDKRGLTPQAAATGAARAAGWPR